MSAFKAITDDDLFFGSERCFFRHVPGTTLAFSPSQCRVLSDPSEVTQQATRLSLKHRVEGHEHVVVVPEVPAVDIGFNAPPIVAAGSDRMEGNNVSIIASNIPEIFHTPLMKCSPQHPDCLHELYGVKSGVRSALIKHNNTWYRLKGCGNNDEGFIPCVHEVPASSTGDDKDTWQEIRGCAFYNTSIRELFYTKSLSLCTSLLDRRVISANESIGLSLYSHPSEALFGTDSTLRPVCIIETTIGDRRFGSHVLAGIELIMPFLLNEDSINISELEAVFPPNRPREALPLCGSESPENRLASVISTDRFICDYCMGTSIVGSGNDPSCQGLCWNSLPRDSSTMANMLLPANALPEKSPIGGQNGVEAVYPQQWTKDGPIDMPPEWRVKWNEVSKDLFDQLDRIQRQQTTNGVVACRTSSASAVLAYLYACTGYDAGNFLRGLHDNDMSWGTFQDSMCRKDLDEWHCNSHSNNFVVIPPGYCAHPSLSNYEGHKPLLSYLDLDMSYISDWFLNINKNDSVKVGLNEEEFTSIKWKEYVNLMEVLAGSDATSGVPQVAKSVVSGHSKVIQGVKSALNDTLILAYMDAYNNNRHPHSGEDHDPELHDAAYSIIKLGMIVMAPFIA